MVALVAVIVVVGLVMLLVTPPALIAYYQPPGDVAVGLWIMYLVWSLGILTGAVFLLLSLR